MYTVYSHAIYDKYISEYILYIIILDILYIKVHISDYIVFQVFIDL